MHYWAFNNLCNPSMINGVKRYLYRAVRDNLRAIEHIIFSLSDSTSDMRQSICFIRQSICFISDIRSLYASSSTSSIPSLY